MVEHQEAGAENEDAPRDAETEPAADQRRDHHGGAEGDDADPREPAAPAERPEGEHGYLLPRLTASATAVPAALLAPAFGLDETTRPLFTFAERTFVTLPALQFAFVSRFLAAAGVLPATFGTTHFAAPGVVVVVAGVPPTPVNCWTLE